MLDAITLEKRGIPAVAAGQDFLVKTVGLAMRQLHGMPEYPVATFPGNIFVEVLANAGELSKLADILAPQVESMLVKKS